MTLKVRYVRQSILSRDANLNKKETLELGAIALSEPEQVKEKFEGGRYLKEKQLTPFPYKVGEVVRISGEREISGEMTCVLH